MCVLFFSAGLGLAVVDGPCLGANVGFDAPAAHATCGRCMWGILWLRGEVYGISSHSRQYTFNSHDMALNSLQTTMFLSRPSPVA